MPFWIGRPKMAVATFDTGANHIPSVESVAGYATVEIILVRFPFAMEVNKPTPNLFVYSLTKHVYPPFRDIPGKASVHADGEILPGARS